TGGIQKQGKLRAAGRGSDLPAREEARMKTRSIAVAVSVICAACAFGAGPAAAETPHAGHTLFSGAMTMSPAIPPMPIFGGSGSFSFSGSCGSASAWVSGGDDLNDRDVAEAGTCYGISFSGYY